MRKISHQKGTEEDRNAVDKRRRLVIYFLSSAHSEIRLTCRIPGTDYKGVRRGLFLSSDLLPSRAERGENLH